MTVGEPSGDLAGHVGGGCTPVHPENDMYKDDGPGKGPQATRGVRGVQGLRRSRYITYAVSMGK